MSINKTVLFFLFISSLAFSQTKKKVDTIFVHEKVFVYKSKPKKYDKKQQFVGLDSITGKSFIEVKRFQLKITADSSFSKRRLASLKKDKQKNKKRFAIDHYGFSVQSLFSQQPELKSYGGGIGIFASKNIYKDKLFLNFEFLFSKVFSVTDATSIDGYYITPDAVLYYQARNVNTQQINVPILLFWKYKKFKPQIGIAFTQKKTELDFAAYKNNTTFSTVLRTSYTLSNNYIDFMYGIEYELTKRIGIVVRSKQTLVTLNENQGNLKQLEELHFFPNQVTFGMIYNLKK